jgi:hypothetical protein
LRSNRRGAAAGSGTADTSGVIGRVYEIGATDP